VRVLVDRGASLEANHINGPLHVSAFSGFLGIVKFLLSKGADPNSVYSSKTAFLHACEGGNLKAAILLEVSGANINEVDTVCQSCALHYACKSESVELCEWLLEKNIKYLIVRNAEDRSPLTEALESCNLEILQVFLKYASMIYDSNVSNDFIRDEMSDVLTRTAMSGQEQIGKFVLEQFMSYAEPLFVLTDGSTLLHLAAAVGDASVAQSLISSGCNINAKSIAGKTPLHYAAITGKLEIGKLLVSHGADVLLADNGGRDAYKLSKYFSHTEFSIWLRSLNASVTAKPKSFFFSCIQSNTDEDELT
jgi:ankyrin repeat protein